MTPCEHNRPREGCVDCDVPTGLGPWIVVPSLLVWCVLVYLGCMWLITRWEVP
jgi:hypothetical protein